MKREQDEAYRLSLEADRKKVSKTKWSLGQQSIVFGLTIVWVHEYSDTSEEDNLSAIYTFTVDFTCFLPKYNGMMSKL